MYDPFVAFAVGMLSGIVIGIVIAAIISAISNNIEGEKKWKRSEELSRNTRKQ